MDSAVTGAPIPPEAPRTPIVAAASACSPPVGFPRGVRYWHGQATGGHWAMVPWPWAPFRYRLIEARTRDELADQVWQLMGDTARHGGVPRVGEGSAVPQSAPSPDAQLRRDGIR